jgi:hypothetical protein
MSTKSYILIPYSLWDHKVQSWWKSSSSLCPLETIEFLEAKKIIFLDRYGLQGLHFLVFKWVRYISTKSYTRKRCRTLRKKLFSIMGYAKIHKQRPFFHNKESIWNTNGEHMLLYWIYILFFCFIKNIKFSSSDGISKFLKLIVFG